jgi:putative Mg2+ transporter-C (MgtC) family protein
VPWWAFIVNAAVALFLGICIGVERQWRQHSAGLRTNSLVALGAALFVGLSILMDHEASPTRIAAQVVSGLGFLGGGVILREGTNIRGLNTAATIWCSGAVGTLAGAGYPLYALAGTALVLVVNVMLRPVSRWIDSRRLPMQEEDTCYRLRIETTPDHDAELRQILLRHVNGHDRLTLQALSTEDTDEGMCVIVAEIYAMERNDRAMEEVASRVGIEREVKSVRWQRFGG